MSNKVTPIELSDLYQNSDLLKRSLWKALEYSHEGSEDKSYAAFLDALHQLKAINTKAKEISIRINKESL